MFFLIHIRGAEWVVELKYITVASMLVLPDNGLDVIHICIDRMYLCSKKRKIIIFLTVFTIIMGRRRRQAINREKGVWLFSCS